MAIAQERGEGGQVSDISQDWVAVPGPDVLPVCSDERVALILSESEPGGLESWNEIDFSRSAADRVPVGEHDAVSVAEQVSPVGVTVDHPGRELEAELAVGVQELFAALPQPGPFVFIDGVAGVDRPAGRDKRPVGGQGDRRQPQFVQPAE